VDSDGVGGPLPPVEKGDLSEKLTRNHQVEYCVFSLFGRRADSHRAGPHCVKLRPDIPFPEYHRASFDFRRNHPGGQAVDDRITQVPEERMRPKQRMLIERLRLRTYPRSHRDLPTRVNKYNLPRIPYCTDQCANTPRAGRLIASVRNAPQV